MIYILPLFESGLQTSSFISLLRYFIPHMCWENIIHWKISQNFFFLYNKKHFFWEMTSDKKWQNGTMQKKKVNC